MTALRTSMENLATARRRREELENAKIALERWARAASRQVVYRARTLLTDATLAALRHDGEVTSQSLMDEIESASKPGDRYAVDLCRDWVMRSQGE